MALSNGLRLAFQEWRPVPRSSITKVPIKRILALHGWLDNSNSFSFLGPFFAAHGFHFVAVDHIGHGLSNHLGIGASYSISKYTACIADFVRNLGWCQQQSQEPFHLVGHSMGASVGMLYAASLHENVDKLVLIEGFGPITAAAEDTAHNLRKALDTEHSMAKKAAAVKKYATLSSAIEARIKAVSFYPGRQFISIEAARSLVSRSEV